METSLKELEDLVVTLAPGLGNGKMRYRLNGRALRRSTRSPADLRLKTNAVPR